jgi:hypothetical protein
MTEFLRSLNVRHHINWGKLVKSWATGKNYFNAAKPAPPIPHTVAELVKTANDHQCDITVAPWVKGLAVISYSHEVLALRLPPKDMIERSEALIRGERDSFAAPGEQGATFTPATYPIPEFYTDFTKIKPDHRTVQDALDFHHARIGEYTMNSCH